MARIIHKMVSSGPPAQRQRDPVEISPDVSESSLDNQLMGKSVTPDA